MSCPHRVEIPAVCFPPLQHVWFHVRLQLEEAANEGDLYRFVTQSTRAFDQAVCAKMHGRRTLSVEDVQFVGTERRDSSPGDTRPAELSEAIMAVLDEGNHPEFERLQEAADR